jgi:hypothetical protein
LSAGAPLWNGTPVALPLVSTLNTYSATIWADEPPYPKVKDFAFPASRNSVSVRAGLAALTVRPWLSIATKATGRRSELA